MCIYLCVVQTITLGRASTLQSYLSGLEAEAEKATTGAAGPESLSGASAMLSELSLDDLDDLNQDKKEKEKENLFRLWLLKPVQEEAADEKNKAGDGDGDGAVSDAATPPAIDTPAAQGEGSENTAADTPVVKMDWSVV